MQMKPSVEFHAKKTTIPDNGTSKPIMSQIWSKSGNCPSGTIPVRRVSREEISRASSPSQFGRKTHQRYSFLDNALEHKGNYNFTAETSNGGRPWRHSEAFAVALGFNYLGAQSDINVWNTPRVQNGDYSTGQIWLFNGIASTFESVEAGWMVNPSVFGDSRARLFTYWTDDAYDKTGCINLLCSGFVQITSRFALGAALDPVSHTNGDQYEIFVSIFLDPYTHNWWLTFGNNLMGYWPGNLFGLLQGSATAVQFGGQVHSPNVRKKPHTRTAMGSGEWASKLFKKACYHTNMRIKDFSLHIKYPQWLSEYADEYNCYSTKLHRDRPNSEPRFYFGGPGQNRRCP
ncbi:unnamed protein product [Microthlaspi erraticum]|uniref:Neprosin PEP catalytic domain-containing protein n=1 Tax=Microthlaspi erraticum TaxID=1685480 RepID=A0A6D2IJ39_9BRAS|nr:unnamed protein product [Microthlaspi erraticum]CAA7053445.1 unnamed protein product [Microthlaspi erraticum]